MAVRRWRLRSAGAVCALLAAYTAEVGVATAACQPPPPFAPPQPPPTSAQCVARFGVACYSPAQMQRAYGLKALYRKGYDGRGRTIIIVDPFGSPTIGADLAYFDKATGLPDPPHFRVIAPVGPIPPFDPTNGAMLDKAGETTGDVELAHMIAPKANILLVETPAPEHANGSGFPKMMAAEEYVFEHDLGDVVSQSFSLPEQNFGRAKIRRLRYPYITAYRHHISVFGASNDNGVSGVKPKPTTLYHHRVVQWPASDRLVTGVGGTTIHLNAAGKRVSPDTAWNDTYNPFVAAFTYNCAPPPIPWASSGGRSVVFRRPSYQRSVRRAVGRRRGVPDVSMNAAISTGVLAYGSYAGPIWAAGGGGTSASTPEFAAIIAIADQVAHKRLGLINPYLYKLRQSHAPGIVDITRGNNTVAFPQGGRNVTVKGYRAGRGYDLVTGVGTPNAALLVRELVALAKGRHAPAG